MPTSPMTSTLEAAADCLLILANRTSESPQEEHAVRRNAAYNLRQLASMLTSTTNHTPDGFNIIPEDFPRIFLK